MNNSNINHWLNSHLVCPRDHHPVLFNQGYFECSNGHKYPCIDGIPVMLVEESLPTHKVFAETLAFSKGQSELPNPKASLGIKVHPYVQGEIVGTNGNLYRSLQQKLNRYPIPEIPLPKGDGQYMLDIGCNWGRWCIAASRKGYCPIGIDPSLKALLAARDVARQLGVDARYVVADARNLPFADQSFDVVFSYSVLQHLNREDAASSIIDAARVLKQNGKCLIQMPNTFGLRNLTYQIRQRFKDPGGFGVRYWTVKQLTQMFSVNIGPTTISVDGFFSLNPQITDIDLLPIQYRLVVKTSGALRKWSKLFPPLLHVADSLYISSIRLGS